MSLQEIGQGRSLEDAFLAAAREIFKVLREQPQSRKLTIALCGGRSVVGLAQAFLCQAADQPQYLLDRVHFFMVDERIVPLKHPDSNFEGLKQQLFNPLVAQGKIAQHQIHPLVVTPEDASEACTRYALELKECGGVFTIVVLGMGEDGHIAGLFPRHSALEVTGGRFIPFFDSPKPPAGRVTASRDLVTQAELAVVLALGEGKRAAWNAFRSEQVSESDCPAKMTLAMRNVVIVSDLY